MEKGQAVFLDKITWPIPRHIKKQVFPHTIYIIACIL